MHACTNLICVVIGDICIVIWDCVVVGLRSVHAFTNLRVVIGDEYIYCYTLLHIYIYSDLGLCCDRITFSACV